ncbi:uncharacterized protein LOC110256161 [Sus scrofa]|uniref:uncharacterized protein LOC110256161 n=1 Tax=Sus scrofa TaxID=9823 RepID=UPI000A2B4E3F|nr:uncharacterized protein LOC110256161 [Sus scrofa]
MPGLEARNAGVAGAAPRVAAMTRCPPKAHLESAAPPNAALLARVTSGSSNSSSSSPSNLPLWKQHDPAGRGPLRQEAEGAPRLTALPPRHRAGRLEPRARSRRARQPRRCAQILASSSPPESMSRFGSGCSPLLRLLPCRGRSSWNAVLQSQAGREGDRLETALFGSPGR